LENETTHIILSQSQRSIQQLNTHHPPHRSSSIDPPENLKAENCERNF